MTDTKPFYLSRGVWGSVAAIVFSGLALAGVVPQVSQDQVVDAAVVVSSLVASLVGGGVALYGRLTATRKIG